MIEHTPRTSAALIYGDGGAFNTCSVYVLATFARTLERELAETAAERDRLKAVLRECRELIAYYATEYEIGDEASELQHWPKAEAERCQKAVILRDRIDAALSRATETKIKGG